MGFLSQYLRGGNDPMFGDTQRAEDRIPKVVAKYKDPDSRKRVMRAMTGGGNVPDSQSEADKIQDLMDSGINSRYALELMDDFGMTVSQLNPLRKRFIGMPESGNVYYLPEREVGMSYSPSKGFVYNQPRDPTLEEFMGGTLGVSDYPYMPQEEDRLAGFHMHSHPRNVSHDALNPDVRLADPSDTDVSNTGLFKTNFVYTPDDVSQYQVYDSKGNVELYRFTPRNFRELRKSLNYEK